MVRISGATRLDQVEYILASGTGVLDFAVEGEDGLSTWEGTEEADWEVEDAGLVENTEEDRFIIYPEGEYFVCEIESATENTEDSQVRCWCE